MCVLFVGRKGVESTERCDMFVKWLFPSSWSTMANRSVADLTGRRSAEGYAYMIDSINHK